MPRQSNGQYVAPANTAAVSGQAISSTAFNTLETDIGTEITNSVDRGGRSAMTGNLPMGGNKVTGAADPAVATDLTTKNYVDTLTATFFSTGDVKFTLKGSPDTGWIFFDDGTIGSATSGATSRANADTQPLFNLIFNGIPDAFSTLFTSGGATTTRAAQTNAATAWAANCRISIPKALGRALAVAGTGAGLTGHSFGSSIGAETVTLAQSALPNVALSYSNSISVTSTESNIFHGNGINGIVNPGAGGIFAVSGVGAFNGSTTSTGTSSGNTSSINGNVAQTAVSILNPTTYLNAMVKL